MVSVSPSRPAKSSDVAALAGVSRATVSHILNGQGDRFPEQTRDKVLAAAAALEYRPSPAGRSLASGRSETIVILVPNTTFGRNLQDAVDQVVADTASFGANVVVRFADPDHATTVDAILRLRPLAVIDLGFLDESDRQRVIDSGVIAVPAAFAGDRDDDIDAQIAVMQLEALAASGPRRMFYGALSDERLDPYGPRRFQSMVGACQARGLPEPEVVRVPLDRVGAIAALRPHAGDGAIGVACYNDDVAMALLAAARELQLPVPDQLSVVGVDHSQIGQLWEPRLTTIDVDMRLIMDGLISDLRQLLTDSQPQLAGRDYPLLTLIPGAST